MTVALSLRYDHVAAARALADFASANPALAEDSLAAVSAQVTAGPVYARGEEFLAVPLSVPVQTWDAVTRVSVEFVAVVDRCVREILQLPDAVEVLGVAPGWIHGARNSPASAIAMSRPDLFLCDEPVLLEANIDSSLGGLGTADALSDLVMKGELFTRFAETSGVRARPPLPVAAGFVGLVSRLRHGKSACGVAIIDWADEIEAVPWPYDRLAESLRALGCDVVIAAPDELRRDGRALTARAHEVDVVFRGVMPEQRLRDAPGALDAAVSAHAAGAALLLTPPEAVAWSSKRVLGRLSERADSGSLHPADRRLVSAVLPWTRMLTDGCTTRDGATVDLLDYVVSRQPELVLKGATGGSGERVVVGAEVDAAVWATAVETAVVQRDSIVQQFVPPPVLPVPVWTGTEVAIVDCQWNVSTFLFGDVPAGSCVRAGEVGGPLRISCARGAREGVVAVLS